MNSFLHWLGIDGDGEVEHRRSIAPDEHGRGDAREIPEHPAEYHDPFAALREQGVIAEQSIPQEIEVELPSDVEPEDEVVSPEPPKPYVEETVPAPENFDAFRTADHADELEDDEPPMTPEESAFWDREADYHLALEEAHDAGINPKDALGMKKPNLALIPSSALLHESMAMMDGDFKYGAYNWRDKSVLAMVYLAAAQRHIAQLIDGEDFDPKSRVHHAGHARACLGIYLDALETGNLSDNRPKSGTAGDMIRRFEEKGDFTR